MSVKARIRVRLNNILEPLGFQISRFHPETTCRHMFSPLLRTRQLHSVRGELATALVDFPDLNLGRVGNAEIAAFLDALADCPVRQQSGGCGVNSALILWFLVRAIQPMLVIESGVLRGFTSWVFQQAVPEAEIHSFDISLAELQFCSPQIHYHQSDWMSVDLRPQDPSRALAFFDDHVDQWRRIGEAAGRGFRFLVFDDNLPAHALHGDGNAAYPTLDMLFDDELPDGELIEWETEAGRFSLQYDRSLALATRTLVRNCVRLPSLCRCTGYSPANLTLVEIAPGPK